MYTRNYPYFRFLLLGWMVLLIVQGTQAQQTARNYLSAALDTSGFVVTATVLENWKKTTKEQYLLGIGQLPDSIKTELLQEADQYLNFSWPALPATSFLEFKEEGIRAGFEKMQDERRIALGNLVVAQLIAGGSKYLPALVNGLWATLEESTWEIPAIVVLQKAGADLPDPEEEVIGLVNAETAVQLSAIVFMLQNELNAVSPMLVKRTNTELKKRILQPYLSRSDFWWMGFTGKSVNNWNVWINQNVFQTALMADLSADSVNLLMKKIARSTDFFINQYPDDGGCDEGPSYWNLAGGKLIRLLDLATELSEGKMQWKDKGLLHRMGRYIYDVHIADNYFVNFADASPVSYPNAAAVYQFSRMFQDEDLGFFAGNLIHRTPHFYSPKSITDFLETARVYEKVSAMNKVVPVAPVRFFDDLGVYILRSTNNNLFVAAQAGHNDESHNHNDVGNFIVYARGKPVLVDAGVGVYTAQTFSSSRYELWNMQSQWHNCPTINGVMQQEGRKFKAGSISTSVTKKNIAVSMDIAGAYPAAAAVSFWQRSFLLNRETSSLTLTDQFRLSAYKDSTQLHFMSYARPVHNEDGQVQFLNAEGVPVLLMKFNNRQMRLQMEEKLMDDEKLKASWRAKLYRLTLTTTGRSLNQKSRIEFFLPGGF